MNRKIFSRNVIAVLCLILVGVFVSTSCDKYWDDRQKPQGGDTTTSSQVLMLIVDYTTNQFEGGKELTFNQNSPTFTITNQYVSPGDFGSVELSYSEINQKLFYGTIIWMGCGKILYPENLLLADDFEQALATDFVFPANGFEPIQGGDYIGSDTMSYKVWRAVQSTLKAREYIYANPVQRVKVYFYTPSVGVGNPADWKWILFLKK